MMKRLLLIALLALPVAVSMPGCFFGRPDLGDGRDCRDHDCRRPEHHDEHGKHR